MTQHLSPTDLQRLVEGSSIVPEVIAARGYRTFTDPGDLLDLGFSKAQARTAPALGIPLWDVHGQQTGWQIRPDSPRQFKDGKVAKYETPKGGRLSLDVHPSVQPLLGDPAIPLWITEGVKKGDALASRAACSIALMGGVWGFKGTNEHGGKVILPDWQHVALNGRLVYVVFDSDISLKPAVEAALKALNRFLRERQARPGLVRWPEEYRQTKIGVDDFLAQGHTLDELLAFVPPMGPLPQTPAFSRNGQTPGTQPEPALPYSDYTNALAFVRDHGQDVRYCHPWNVWLVWAGSHWQRDTSGAVMRLAKQTVKRLARQVEHLDDEAAEALMKHIKTSLSTAKLKAMIENAQSEEGIPVQPEDLDTDPWVLNVANGTLELTTGTLRPHARADLLTFALAVAYDPAATAPTWEAFLARVMADNPALLTFLQRAIGYALTGVIREHVLLILWGRGRNGKSTFLNILRKLLGAYAMKAPSELLMVSHNDRHPTERADLWGKRLVAAIETEQGRKLAEVFVKEATGGDPIRARRMREDFWEFQPTHKVFLATNHKPVITGTDTAIWERLKLVPFTVTIPEGERDTTLPEKLEQELPGILNWGLQGCRAWQQDGLGEPDEVRQATAGYRSEMDVLGQFIDACCLVGPHYRVKASDLYEAYQHWCHEQGESAEVQRTWGMRLTERGYERKRGTGGSHWWLGIGLYQQPPSGQETDAQAACDERVTQVTDSTQKTALTGSEISHEGRNRNPGSLGSLGSLGEVDERGRDRLPTQRTENKEINHKMGEQADEGRPENGINGLRNPHEASNAVSSSTSSTSSTSPPCAVCGGTERWQDGPVKRCVACYPPPAMRSEG